MDKSKFPPGAHLGFRVPVGVLAVEVVSVVFALVDEALWVEDL